MVAARAFTPSAQKGTNQYVDDLRELYRGRVPGGADLVTFWFERARAQIEAGKARRAGLLATNSITMMGNRPVVQRIKQTGDIFMAWSDRPWILDGAAVRVSMIGFDNGDQKDRRLDGAAIPSIHSDLTGASGLTSAKPLDENHGLCFLGMMKAGSFDITADLAKKMMLRPKAYHSVRIGPQGVAFQVRPLRKIAQDKNKSGKSLLSPPNI